MLFGTDGVRGVVDIDVTSELAYNIGKGVALGVLRNKKNKKVIVGCDTRTSSDTLMSAICCGFSDYGINVDIVGIASTPSISYIVSQLDYSAGVMITASHNDNTYNGIKLFNEIGEKYDVKLENKVEKYIQLCNKKVKNKGHIKFDQTLLNYYIDNLIESFKCDLSDMTIVIDSANGSNYMIAPYVFKKLGANVIKLSCDNNGKKINHKCGANDIRNLIEEVKYHKADIGIAFDGDGDRLRIVLDNGKVLSGDDILLVFALYLKKTKKINNLSMVGTIMSNLGFEKTLNNNGITLYRSDVGDKNVISLMKKSSSILGGEPSGHICILNYLPTCDALYNSIFLIYSCKKMNINIKEILNESIYYPSIIKNVEINSSLRKNFNSNSYLKKQIKSLEKKYSDYRIIVRPSGTEPVLRLYVEGVSEEINLKIIEELEELIKNSN